MSNLISFSSSLIPVPTVLFKSSLYTGLTVSMPQALSVSHDGIRRDFSRIDDPRSITFDDAEWANYARQQKNDLPMLAIFEAFHDQILGRVSQLWTVHCDRGPLVQSALIGVAWALLPIHGRHSFDSFYDLAIAKIESRMASIHTATIEKTYLSRYHEKLRNVVHNLVAALRIARCRNPEFTAAYDLGIPYLRVVQLLSLAGAANPEGPMPASDPRNMGSALALWQTSGQWVLATD